MRLKRRPLHENYFFKKFTFYLYHWTQNPLGLAVVTVKAYWHRQLLTSSDGSEIPTRPGGCGTVYKHRSWLVLAVSSHGCRTELQGRSNSESEMVGTWFVNLWLKWQDLLHSITVPANSSDSCSQHHNTQFKKCLCWCGLENAHVSV